MWHIYAKNRYRLPFTFSNNPEVDYVGQYLKLIWIGMGFLSLGFGLFIDLSANFSMPKIAIFEIVAGIGVGLCFQSPLIALQSLVEARDMATATATFGFMRNIACSISVAVGGIVFQNGMSKQSGDLKVVLTPDLAEKFSGASAGANVDLVADLSAAQRTAVRSAYVASLRDMWILYACAAGLGLIASLFIRDQVLQRGIQSRGENVELHERNVDVE